MTAHLAEIRGVVRDYAWGTPGGISRALGMPASDAPEAELWLGSHPSAPSRFHKSARWADLAAWERSEGTRVPFLLKLLSAASPLSLQAHPTPEQAAEGFAREEAAGIARDARERNYKDPHAKPELIVALEDGFEALCGFRPVAETLAVIDALAAEATDPEPFAVWRDRLAAAEGIRAAFEDLLAGGPAVQALVAQIADIAARLPGRFEPAGRIATEYPGDPGIAIALMLNHVTLRRGEALWLPAGNIHAYLCGTGVELMGPSDNVLRGGLTPKHIDIPELTRVLDFTPGPAPYLPPISLTQHAVTYRPRSLATGSDVPFELIEVTADDTVATTGPAIGLLVDGAFTIDVDGETIELERGRAVFVSDAATLGIRGSGRLFVATV